MIRVLIGADGCPVVNEVVRLCGRFGVGCLILCNTSRCFEKVGARTLVISRGIDNADFALVNLLWPDDVIAAQDYGLAAVCMTYDTRTLNQDDMEHMARNIDAPLPACHTVKEARSADGRLKGPRKRLSEQDQAFYGKLACLLGEE